MKRILILVFIVILAVLAAVGIVVLRSGFSPEEPEDGTVAETDVPSTDVFVTIDAPLFARVREEFPIRITIENRSTVAHVVDSIDIGNTFVEGVAIRASTPGYRESFYVSQEDYQAWSYEYQLLMPAQSAVEIVLTAVPLQKGDFHDRLNICIDGPSTCLFNSIRAVVSETPVEGSPTATLGRLFATSGPQVI